MSETRSIGALARAFGLSRSALLHDDRLGLLRPSKRTAKGYRLYTAEDAARLEEICTLRRAGLGLSEIRALLGREGGASGPWTARSATARRKRG